MPDYQQMYLTMMRAAEKALNILIEAQQECEEIYLSDEGPELKLLSFKQPEEDKK